MSRGLNEFGSSLTANSDGRDGNGHANGKRNGHSEPLKGVLDREMEIFAPSPFADGDEPEPSKYLALLPAIYSADPFVGRFLRIFEDILDPVEMMVDNQPYYFDPITSPVELLKWLAFWVDMDDEGNDWALPKKRALVEAAAAIYRMRGTHNEIKRHLGIYTGGLQLIMERTNGFRLGPDARLGLNSSIGEDRPSAFTVTIAVPNPRDLDISTIRSIIESDKPVNTQYILRVVKLDLPTKKKKTRRKK